MPTEIPSKSRASPLAEILDPLLASTCRGLIAVAISLAIVVMIQLEITSWQTGGIDESTQAVQLMVASP
jgi:hypothetical protein